MLTYTHGNRVAPFLEAVLELCAAPLAACSPACGGRRSPGAAKGALAGESEGSLWPLCRRNGIGADVCLCIIATASAWTMKNLVLVSMPRVHASADLKRMSTRRHSSPCGAGAQAATRFCRPASSRSYLKQERQARHLPGLHSRGQSFRCGRFKSRPGKPAANVACSSCRSGLPGRKSARTVFRPFARTAKQPTAGVTQHSWICWVRQKRCCSCNVVKDAAELHKANTSSDGLGVACKACLQGVPARRAATSSGQKSRQRRRSLQ